MPAPSCPKCGAHDRATAETIGGGTAADPVPVWMCNRCDTVFRGTDREWDHPLEAKQRRDVWSPYFDRLDALRAERDPELPALLNEALARVSKYGNNPIQVLVDAHSPLVLSPEDGSLDEPESPF